MRLTYNLLKLIWEKWPLHKGNMSTDVRQKKNTQTSQR